MKYGQSLDEMSTKSITLTVQTTVHRMMLAQELNLANVDVSTVLSDYAAAFVVRIAARMPGQTVETHTYPKTWIDAFKVRWFPKWALAKWPANFTTVETWHCYPEYPLQNQRAVQYLVVK